MKGFWLLSISVGKMKCCALVLAVFSRHVENLIPIGRDFFDVKQAGRKFSLVPGILRIFPSHPQQLSESLGVTLNMKQQRQQQLSITTSKPAFKFIFKFRFTFFF